MGYEQSTPEVELKMKWLKLDTDNLSDDKIEELLAKHGAEGYGIYVACISLIGEKLTADNQTVELKHSPAILAHKLYVSEEKVQEILDSCIEIGLFQHDSQGIECSAMWKRVDDTTRRELLYDKRGGRPVPKALIKIKVRQELAAKYGITKDNPQAEVKCAYCDAKTIVARRPSGGILFGGFEIDHIIPESRGGTTEADNLQLCCKTCNRSKGSKNTPGDSGISPTESRQKRREEKRTEQKRTEEKREYAEGVTLTPTQNAQLVEKYGPELTKAAYEKLSSSKLAKGYKYKSDYHAILNWVMDEVSKKAPAKPVRKVVHKFCGSCGKEYWGSACDCGWSE